MPVGLMGANVVSTAETVLAGLTADLPGWEAVYTDLHQHPELAYAEHRTASIGAQRLRDAGYQVNTGIGGTGVVALLHNGPGPTVLLRADMDALPLREQTGLPYASSIRSVDANGNKVWACHACGHDMHVTWLLGAATLLAAHRDQWHGTLQIVLQPAEEAGGGAQRMVDDGLFARFGTPDIAFGQHVGPVPAGMVMLRPGVTMSASDTYRVTLFGRGGHSSRPETTVDPVVMAASTVLRLQTVVSREVAATDSAVVTVGSLHAGTQDNIIPDQAELTVDVRSYSDSVRSRVTNAVHRIIRAEAQAAGADREPEITLVDRYPLTVNEDGTTGELIDLFRDHFGDHRVHLAPEVTGSEDFGVFGAAAGIPSVFWFVGGADPERFQAAERAGTLDQDVPSNHSPRFAPVPHPTLATGIETLVTAALHALD